MNKTSYCQLFKTFGWILTFVLLIATSCRIQNNEGKEIRQKISITEGWSFYKYPSREQADNLIYDARPEVSETNDAKDADSKPTEAVMVETSQTVLKSWILPSGNDFIKNPEKKHVRPAGNPGADFPFVQADFDDSSWEKVNLPHDWAIEGPFQKGWDAEVSGGMGRLPVYGVAWYRKKLNIPETDAGKSVFLQVDGAMSYAIVWLNGHLVGGWPYGYNSWQLDLTPYIEPGGENQLAIRIDNPNHSARWYPGAGIYRNVWLIKTHPVHVSQWGSFMRTVDVNEQSAKLDFSVSVENDSDEAAEIEINTEVYFQDKTEDRIAEFPAKKVVLNSGESSVLNSSATIENPRLWGPPPTQTPNLYVAVTQLKKDGKIIDSYETTFGIRTLKFSPDEGIFVNGELVPLKGANMHHDLGALGGAFNKRAAERQLEILRKMGCNAIRTAHNPPAPELLELTDRMGFLVVDEIFDVWERKKTPLDFHLIFPDWYEADTRSFIRRDRNHPSVIMWSYGNEVGEQYTGEEGAALAKKLSEIVNDEDSTRPSTASMNYAKPNMHFPTAMKLISLNYQGEGIRNAPAYEGLQGINTPPLYPAFHEKFPDKVIVSSENAAALSSRGTYLFPVHDGISAPVKDGNGGDPNNQYVSAYELYTAPFGSSADKVFASLDRHPYVAGGFVWSGWDYLGEPTPYYSARSSYYGVIDLAGFKKDRFYLYQSHWRPDHPMAHILPHWNWPERVGKTTPVHVFTSGDEAELFLNGKSLGRKEKGEFHYRLRWDDVKYEPGELKVVAYKNGERWAEDLVKTTDEPTKLNVSVDRNVIKADGKDLAFITIKVTDENGLTAPQAENLIEFGIEGPGKIMATDNGDPADMTAFTAHQRKAFSGLVLAIVKSAKDKPGTIILTAKSDGLEDAVIEITSK